MSKKNPIVMLDAGHYAKYNQSPYLPEYWESERMWELHLMLKAQLEAYGITVKTTRPDQKKDLGVVERGAMALGCDLFISLHSNAANAEYVDRVEVYAAFDNLNNSHTLGAYFAGAIADIMEVSDGGFVKTLKSKNGDYEYYGVLRGARAAGCPLYFIIEHSFHTNIRAAKWLMSNANLLRLAKAEAAIIAEYFGIKTPYCKGDLSGDGIVDELDYTLLKRAIMGTYTLGEKQLDAADVYEDGEIDVFDYVALKRQVMRLK